jgi:DNA-binding transcriptional ArsR family regulator
VLNEELNATFAALVDPTRRAILAQLSRRPGLSISELAKPFAMTLPAVTKHLGVLCDAGLVKRRKVGRTVYCELVPARLARAARWIDRTSTFWETRLDNLAAVMETQRARR